MRVKVLKWKVVKVLRVQAARGTVVTVKMVRVMVLG
jgi:hypothetical protein